MPATTMNLVAPDKNPASLAPIIGAARRNQAVFDRHSEEYLNRPLFAAELELLRLYRDRWPQTDMLDLGVGTGRTSLTFSILARTYVGIDYAPRMIVTCRSLIRESESVRFEVGDATDLSAYYGRRFDVVLFSFNGIDCVSHVQRLQVLGEVRKLLKPGGHFLFSGHSLAVFPFRLKLPSLGSGGIIRWAYRTLKRLIWFAQQKWFNRQVRIEDVKRRGWAILADGDHGFRSRYCYTSPAYQIRQLDEQGFETVAVLDRRGAAIDPESPPDDTWLHYLCRLKTHAESNID